MALLKLPGFSALFHPELLQDSSEIHPPAVRRLPGLLARGARNPRELAPRATRPRR